MTPFHDPEHWLGRAMPRKLSWKNHVAWDTYFVYGPAESWTDTEILAPAVWFHQLKDREMWEQTAEADPAQFRTGEDLRRSLEEAVRTASKAAAPA